MKLTLLLTILALLATATPSDARTSSAFGSSSTAFRPPRSCHCDRYLNPHYSGYVPRTGAYRGGVAPRY